MKIKAAETRGAASDFTIEELDLAAPEANEVMVRIHGVGVCHTDIAARDQQIPVQLPAVLGHEGAGTVEQVGANVTKVKPGDHVVLTYIACGQCSPCENNHQSHCEAFVPLNFLGSRLDGSKALKNGDEEISSHFFGQSSFGSLAIAYEDNVIKVRDDAPLDLLGPLGCGIQTGAGSIMRSMACEAGSAVAVVGGGAVGLSAVLGAVVQGCNPIIVIEPHENRRQLAMELGATHTINPIGEQDLTKKIRDIVPTGVNYALDSTCIQDVITSILGAMAAGGTLGLVGVPRPESPELSFDILTMLLSGISVKGISEGGADPEEFIPTMVDLFMNGKFPFDKLCKSYLLEDINQAVHDQHDGSCIKAILQLQ